MKIVWLNLALIFKWADEVLQQPTPDTFLILLGGNKCHHLSLSNISFALSQFILLAPKATRIFFHLFLASYLLLCTVSSGGGLRVIHT
jgi:hypothetical protein